MSLSPTTEIDARADEYDIQPNEQQTGPGCYIAWVRVPVPPGGNTPLTQYAQQQKAIIAASVDEQGRHGYMTLKPAAKVSAWRVLQAADAGEGEWVRISYLTDPYPFASETD